MMYIRPATDDGFRARIDKMIDLRHLRAVWLGACLAVCCGI